MIEATLSYDLFPGINLEEYLAFSKESFELIAKAPGSVEIKVYRNIAGSPQVKTVSVWKDLTDWANFVDSPDWHSVEWEMRNRYATNISLSLWKPSPLDF
jgi:heme-degrading monooxygenase HmoA